MEHCCQRQKSMTCFKPRAALLGIKQRSNICVLAVALLFSVRLDGCIRRLRMHTNWGHGPSAGGVLTRRASTSHTWDQQHAEPAGLQRAQTAPIASIPFAEAHRCTRFCEFEVLATDTSCCVCC